MPRSILALIVVVILLVAGVFLLAHKKTGREPVRVEKVVPLENLAR